jgi:integrase
MSRPRKPSDPTRWPQPCGRCGEHHQLVAAWPDARVCGYCYLAAKRTTGTCRCGHHGVLPGRLDGAPACRVCTGITLNVDCRSCGREDELHSGGRCWRCVLAATVEDLLTDPTTGQISAALVPVADALKAMERPNSGLTWIKQDHVTAFLTALARTPVIGHDALDALPSSRTRDYVRGLLVEHGALPRRDERLARFIDWSEHALHRLPEGEHRDIARRFIRWHLLRRMNAQDGEVSEGTFLRSKQTTTVAIAFLNWLTEHDIVLPDLTQHHLDRWQAGGPSTREIASRFLGWAITAKLIDPDLRMTPHRRGTSAKLPAAEQDQALHAVLASSATTEALSPRDRLALILVLMFGQQIEDVVQMSWDQVDLSDDPITLTIGEHPIQLQPPLDEPLRRLQADPAVAKTAAHVATRWLFPGGSLGRPVTAAHLRQRIKTLVSTRAARLGALHELTKLSPVPILAETLGYSPATIERHATTSAATYAQYIAARR